MSVPFRVTIKVGAWSTVCDSTVADDPGAGVWVLDGFKQAWTLPDEWPAQPDPGSCQFTVAAIDPIGLPPLEVGTPIRVQVEATFSLGIYLTLSVFHGRVSDATARPTTLPMVDPITGDRDRVAALAVEFIAVDYLADLAETYIGAAPWPQEYPADRVDRIFAAAGLDWLDLVSFNTYDSFAALDVDHQPVAKVLEDHLAQIGTVGNLASLSETGWQRPYVTPIVAPAGGDVNGNPEGFVSWAITAHQERATIAGGPMRLVQSGLVLGLEVDGSETYWHVAGTDFVDVDISMKRNKGKSVNRVIISGEFAGLFGELGPSLLVTQPTVEDSFEDLVTTRGPVTRSLDSTLAYLHSAKTMAAMYLGDRADLAGRWGVESFTLYASDLDQAGANAAALTSLMPPYEQGIPGYNALWPYGRPVVLSGLQPAHRLTPWPWLTGALESVEFTLVDGDFEYELGVRPDTPRQAWAHQTEPWATSASTPACCRTLQENFPTVTYRDKGDGTPYVDPSLTFYDLRLARSE